MYLDARCALNAPLCLVNYIFAFMFGKYMPGFVYEFIRFIASSINLKSFYIYDMFFVNNLNNNFSIIAFQRPCSSLLTLVLLFKFDQLF